MHGSLLPKYRGRVPVNWAIIHGERHTGASLHRMVAKPDAGEMIAQQTVPILPDDIALDVFQKVVVAAEIALDGALPALMSGTALHTPLNLTEGSYFGGRNAEDGRINWTHSALQIHNLIRAVAPPYPGAFTDVQGKRLRILRSHLEKPTSVQSSPPSLYSDGTRIRAVCGDGRTLELWAEHDGHTLDAHGFASVFGTMRISAC